jgi:hypothetical protein
MDRQAVGENEFVLSVLGTFCWIEAQPRKHRGPYVTESTKRSPNPQPLRRARRD